MAAALLALLLAGCEVSDSLYHVAGHYDGFVANPLAMNAVSAEATFNAKKLSAEIRIKPEPDSERIILQISAMPKNELRLSSSEPTDYLEKPLTLTLAQKPCYTSASPQTAMLCLEDGELQLFLKKAGKQGYTTFCLSKKSRCKIPSVGSTLPHEEVPPKEAPASYTVEQLMERAKTRDFSNLAEFEKVLQAKLTAKNAKLDLLPHQNINTILALSTATPQTILAAIGDIAPFFLPNRWEQAAALEDDALAEQDAFRILQASAMNTVQGLALMVLRDEAVLERLQENRLSVIAIRDEVLTSEQTPGSIVQVGTSDEVNIILESFSRMINTLQEGAIEERLSLSQAAGFMNPLAVANVLPVEVPTVTGPIAGAPPAWEQAAIERSLQLRQLDHLVNAAQHSFVSRFYQWIDPDGADAGSLGLGLPSYIEIGASKIRELFDMKADAQSRILKKVDQALIQSQLVFENYRVAVESSRIDERRIARLLLNFRTGNFGPGTSFNLADLAEALQDKALNDIYQIDGLFSQLALLAQLDFLTFKGLYSPLAGENP